MTISNFISSATITSVDPVRVNTAISGRESRSQISSQYWRIQTTLKTLSEAETRVMLALIATSKTSLNTFTVTPPFATNASSYSATISCPSGGSVGVQSITVRSGTNPSGATPIAAGEFFKFAGHNKVYLATGDLSLVLTSGNFEGTLSFYPSLQTAVAINEVVTYTSVPFTTRIASDPGIEYGLELFGGMQLDLKEVI